MTMRRCRFPWIRALAGAAVVAAAVATAPAIAGMFARIDTPEDAIRTWRVDTGHGGIFVGEIVDREVRRVELPEMGEVEVTALRVRVTDKVTRRPSDPDEIRVVFLGGDEYRTSAQPSDRETQVGVTVAMLLVQNPFPEAIPGRALWLSGLDAIYPVKVNASGDRVVLGKWTGMAVHRNTLLSEFLAAHRAALARVVESTQIPRGGK
jgi:hypothetical protein